MYKPVPFFLSNQGWGALVHSAAPMTFDLGQGFDVRRCCTWPTSCWT
jgi:alpha-glucosidase (family GH31 glycosyl hydrolase)